MNGRGSTSAQIASSKSASRQSNEKPPSIARRGGNQADSISMSRQLQIDKQRGQQEEIGKTTRGQANIKREKARK